MADRATAVAADLLAWVVSSVAAHLDLQVVMPVPAAMQVRRADLVVSLVATVDLVVSSAVVPMEALALQAMAA